MVTLSGKSGERLDGGVMPWWGGGGYRKDH